MTEVGPVRDHRKGSISREGGEGFVSLRKGDENVKAAVELLNDQNEGQKREIGTPALWTDGFQEVIIPPNPGKKRSSEELLVFADSAVVQSNAQNTIFNPTELSLEHLLGPPGSPHATMGHSDDLFFEYTILKKKLIEETATAKTLKDKNYFLLLKVKAKDEQIQSIKESLRSRTKTLQETMAELTSVKSARDQLGKKVALMEAHQMQLEYEKYKLQTTASATKTTEDDNVVHSRGVEKAKLLLAHQIFKQQSDRKVEALRIKNIKTKKDFRRRLQVLETICMEYEDEYNSDTLHSLMNTLRFGKYQQDREARANVGRDLRFNDRVQFTAPDDSHVKALTERSDYALLITKVKEELGEPTKEIKLLFDRSLQTLWLLFNEKSSRLSGGGSHASAKPFRKLFEEFYKTIEQSLLKSKVAEVIRTTRYSTCDKEIEVNIRPPTPAEIYDLRHEVTMYQKRLKLLNQESAEKEHAMELRATKAESSLEYLQRHILSLHRSLFNTLHLVYKHRFRWTPRLPDPMRTLRIPEAKDRTKAMEVGFNMKLGELLQSDNEYMEEFGNYMISEDFGANAVEKRRRVDDDEPTKLPKAPGGFATSSSNTRSRRLSEVTERKSSLPSFAQPIGNVKGKPNKPRYLPFPHDVETTKESLKVTPDPDPSTTGAMRRADTCRAFPSRNSV